MRNWILKIISNPIPDSGVDASADSALRVWYGAVMPFKFTYSVETGCVFQILL